MAKDYKSGSDVGQDTRNDAKNDTRSDYGGDLAKNDGLDLNKYPSNDGFVKGTEENITLQHGDTFDRYGHPQAQGGAYEGDVAEFIRNDTPNSFYGSETKDLGFYASPVDTPYEQRSLEGGSEDRIRYEFETQNPVDAKSGIASPWYGQEGGGTQYQFGSDKSGEEWGNRIDTMMENDDIKPISVSFEVDSRKPNEIGEDLNAAQGNEVLTLPEVETPLEEP